MAFKLNGGTSKRGPKNDWPVRVVAQIIKLTQDGVGAKEAFKTAIDEYNATSPKVPLFAPPSLEEYSASILWGMRKRFVAKCNNPKNKEQKEAIAAAAEYGIGQDVPAEVAATETEA